MGPAYRVCWTHDASLDPGFSVEIDETAGLVGPSAGRFACTLGVPCGVLVEGSRPAPATQMSSGFKENVCKGRVRKPMQHCVRYVISASSDA